MADSSQLTYAGILVAVLLNQACLPVPAVVVLMGAGALSAHGDMRLSVVIFMSVLGCLAGDGIWFSFGRRYGTAAMRLLCRFADDPRKCSRNAQEKFQRHGLPVLCVSKFIPGLDGLIPPLSGAQGVSAASFFAVDIVGSFLWSGFNVSLGYLFSKQLDVAIHWAQRFATVLCVVVGIPLALYAMWRGVEVLRMIRQLQLRRISPRMLDRKLKSRKKVAVLGLENLEPETSSDNLEAIPGAFRLDPTRLRESPNITVPDDVDIVLYCSSRSDIVSARAALGLKRLGINNVWVLEGGLKAWREEGLPVTHPAEAELAAARFGVKLPQP
jgi:membrane protein DedA with SNARE-associated domain/rhodanese-related sulfurtransferase